MGASVGAFVMMALTESQFVLMRNTKSIQSKMTALELTKEIISTLEAPPPDCEPPCTWSKSECTNTLEGFNDVSGTQSVKTAILSTTDSSNPTPSEVYSTSMNYNGVSIKEMKVVSGDTGDNMVILKVWFEADEGLSGITSSEMSRPFDIYTNVNYVAGTNKVESCTAVASYSLFSGKTCGDNEYFKGFDNTGAKKCVSLPRCPSGRYLAGFNSSGQQICRTLSSVAGQSCSSGKYLAGFTSGGSKICRTLPSPSTSLPLSISPPPSTPPPPPPPQSRCQTGYSWSEECETCYRCGGTEIWWGVPGCWCVPNDCDDGGDTHCYRRSNGTCRCDIINDDN